MVHKDRSTAREYDNNWYKSRSPEWKKARNEKVRKRIRDLQQFIVEYKSIHPCKCGESHPACLEFHHLDSKEKEICIANAVKGGWSIRRILLEIEKCIVICSNCHKKLHWNKKITSFVQKQDVAL